MVILVTGKAGAGKTTYSRTLARELMRTGVNTIVLDSDEVRGYRKNTDFSDDGRHSHLMEMAHMAAVSEGVGAIVIVAAIAPRRKWRDQMRSQWKESRLVYLPGGTLWEGTVYEAPVLGEEY